MKQKLQWFKDKFQAMVINRFGKIENKHEMYLENKKILSEHYHYITMYRNR